ncbi:MAG: hypothetical protein AAGE52_33210 [Myxococcota bacterium]
MRRPGWSAGGGYFRHHGWVLAFVVCTLFTATAHATPPDVFGYGPRTQAMGMTGVAYADNYEAIYANPAGLGAQRNTGVALGLQAGNFELKLDGERFALDSFNGSTIGLHIPLPFGGPLKDVIVIGAGFYTPSSTVLQTDIIFPETAQMAILSRTQSVTVQLGFGLNLDRAIPGLRVGFGVSALANIGGRLLVRLDETNQFISQTETQLLASFNPLIGFQLDIGDFTIGAVWRDKVRSDIDLRIEVEDLPVEFPIITITAIPQFDPHVVAAELAWRPSDHWMAALNLTYRRWSTYPGVVGRSSSNSNLPPAPDFRDTVSPRLGVEWRGTKRRTTGLLRFGYSYEMTPAPAARMAPGRDSEGEDLLEDGSVVMRPVRYLDADRHILTLGGGVHWESKIGLIVRLDLFGQLHRMVQRTHNIPSPGNTENLTTEGWVAVGGWALNLDW